MITKYKVQSTKYSAFTLIELLVVISIIGILIGLSIFGLQGARESSRDAVRKADLEQVRSALAMYKADCDSYPLTLNLSSPSQLIGNNSLNIAACSSSNVYMSATPVDPMSPNSSYVYDTTDNGVTYEICASLEQGGTTVTCNGSNVCGDSATCNYKVTNP